MKGRLFDKGTFRETFAQLKVAGILFSVLGALTSILYTVGLIVDRVEYNRLVSDLDPYLIPSQAVENVVFSVEFYYILYVVALVFVPMMVLMVFSFLTKRNSCDFYHAVPVRRSAMYISMITAIIVWIVIIYVCVCAFSMVIIGFDPGMSVDMLGACDIILETIVSGILILGAFSLGTALTGTGTTNGTVSLMILVGPRLLITILQIILEELIPYSEMSYGSWFLNNSYNILFRLLEDSESQATVEFGLTLLYSAVVGIVYICIGGFVFTKRKSETAAQATAHPAIQTVCKMVPSYMCALFAVWGVLEIIINKDDDPSSFFAVAVLMIISIAIYLIYDVITNRKARSFVKSVKQLPIFFGIIILSGVILGAVTYYEKEWKPVADEIDGVEFFSLDYIYTFLGVDRLEIDDEEVNKIVVDAYNRQMKNDDYIFEFETTGFYDTELVVGIKSGIRTRYRRVSFTEKEYNTIVDACGEYVANQGYSIKLPVYNQGYTNIYVSELEFLEADEKRIYDCIKDEISGKDITELLTYEESTLITMMFVNIESDYPTKRRRITLPIADNLPKSKKLIMECAYERACYYEKNGEEEKENSSFATVEKWVAAGLNKEEAAEVFAINDIITNADVAKAKYKYMEDTLTESEDRKLFSILQKVIEDSKTIEENDVIVYMYLELPSEYFAGIADDDIYYEEDENGIMYSVEVAYKISEDTAKELMEFIDTLEFMKEEDGHLEYEIYD